MKFFITGGSRGIGAGLVRDLLLAGHDVAFTFRGRADLSAEIERWATKAAPNCICKGYQLDVRDSKAVEAVVDQVVEEFDVVDAAVLNAATNWQGLAFAMSDDDWREVIDVNLTGAFFVCRQLLPVFLSNGGGRFIHIASVAMYGMSGLAGYAASKGGLCSLSATLAKEYGRKRITSNVLVLGFFDTDMTRELMPEHLKAFWREYCPVSRVGESSEVSEAVLYFASEGGAFANGVTLDLTGGLNWAP
jgi:3-oxoacyl-[acyl-carrier protein] reductase